MRIRRILPVVAGAVLFVYAVVALDLTWRARGAYLEGEKYMRWHEHPELRRAHFDARFNEEKSRLDASKASGRIADAEYRQRLALAKFERDEGVAESSAKEAYHWFQTAAELCSPPESRWVRRSRERMAEALRLWRQELDAAKIPYQEYMLE